MKQAPLLSGTSVCLSLLLTGRQTLPGPCENRSIKSIAFENPFHDFRKFTTQKVDLAHKWT